MVLLQLTDGISTVYISNTSKNYPAGYDYGGNFYAPEITQASDISFEGAPFVSVRTGKITCEYKEVEVLTTNEVDATLYIWDEELDTVPINVFTGKALRTDETVKDDKNFLESVYVIYYLRTDIDELSADLLSAAPDLKQVDTDATTYNDNRVLPINFGYIKYANAFQLAVTCAAGCGGKYSSDGKTITVTENGLDSNFTQGAGDDYIVYNPTTGQPPVYQLTQDIDSTATTASSVTAEPTVIPPQAALTIDNVVIPESVDGTDYISYVVDTNNEKTFSIDQDGNTFQRGISLSANGTNSTATRLTIIGGTAPSSGLTTSTRLDFTSTEDGQTHFYTWNTSTNAGWVETASVGVKNSGSDSFIFYATTDTALRTCYYGKSTSSASVVGALATGGGDAVNGTTQQTSGYGIHGICTVSNGVAIYGNGATAVKGYSESVPGIGVHGISNVNLGIGIKGEGVGTTSIGGEFTGNAGSIKLTPQDGGAVTGTPSEGLIIINNNSGWMSGKGLYRHDGTNWVFVG